MIGSFQGSNVFLEDFSADATTRKYSATLVYEFSIISDRMMMTSLIKAAWVTLTPMEVPARWRSGYYNVSDIPCLSG